MNYKDLNAGDFILYEKDGEKFIGEVISKRKSKFLVVDAILAIDLNQWDAEHVVDTNKVIQKLDKLKTIRSQVEEFYPHLLI